MTDGRDTSTTLNLRYDAAGLVTAIVVDAGDGAVLMVAHMNAAAVARTRAEGFAVFWSRSRQALWMKGETSGNRLRVREICVDCDQDAILLVCDPEGPACHTGQRSCFYRRVEADDRLTLT